MRPAMAIERNLKGFRDFLPAEKTVRDWVQGKIVEAFLLHGFQPVETPTLEYASLIMGKYGEDADRLVYTFDDRGGRKVALPYDQTVPSARVLTQHRNELPRYFRRYAIRNVFRAERPEIDFLNKKCSLEKRCPFLKRRQRVTTLDKVGKRRQRACVRCLNRWTRFDMIPWDVVYHWE